MKSRIFVFAMFLAVLVFAWGCSDKKPTSSNPNPGDTTSTSTTVWNNDGYWQVVNLDARNSDNYVYYSFSRKDTMMLSDGQARNNADWNIAFKRSSIIINGGVSGIGEDDGLDLGRMHSPDSTNFMAIHDMSGLPDSGYTRDSYDLMINEWYNYDMNSHQLTPSRYVYIMKDALGGYVKFQVIDIHGGTQNTMGTIAIQYIYAGASPSFSGAPDTLTFTDSTGNPVYVDFSTGTVTHPSDPANSNDWDLEFTNYEIHQNSSVFGHSSAGTYEVWGDQTDPTDFNETQEAPTVPQAYFADQFGSVMTDWYSYNGDTHTLTSKNHVYIIRDGAHHFKLQIVSYYKEINGSPVSGYYTFRWLTLD